MSSITAVQTADNDKAVQVMTQGLSHLGLTVSKLDGCRSFKSTKDLFIFSMLSVS
jgi:hypothetical protein